MPSIRYYGLLIEYTTQPVSRWPRYIFPPNPFITSAELVDLEEWVRHPQAIAPLENPLAWAREYAWADLRAQMSDPDT